MQNRPHLLLPLRPELHDIVGEVADDVAYFWFLAGEPQPFDYCEEANRRAHPVLLSGGVPTVRPDQLRPEDVGYYANPYDRLGRLHVGGREMTTGFGFAPLWPTTHW